MKTILILGAGLSASSLIRYLLRQAEAMNWQVRIVDQDIEIVKKKIGENPNGIALNFNALNKEERLPEIQRADIVISMLPARFHVEVALDCIACKKHLITPSYISPEMKKLDALAKQADILIMNEIGVDPGIDHMSAMKIIHSIQQKGGKVLSFNSFCGGLIAPESDNNPWHYKFTWNPRNVIVAGQGGVAKFIEQGEYKYIPYQQLFERTDKLNIDGFGEFEGYANRDSLSYRSTYGLEDIPSIYRGTLRRPGFCAAWNVFVELGMTDDSYEMENSEDLTNRTFLNSFLAYDPVLSLEEKFKRVLGPSRQHLYEKFEWLGFFNNTFMIGIKNATPAQILEKILVEKWKLSPTDKDMLVMHHEFTYEWNGEQSSISSSMVSIGEDPVYTAMSNTVGLPVGIATKMILQDQISERGVTLPIRPEVYEPILLELEELGIRFTEKELLTK